MSDKTTATERLRQLLDERGVEWQEPDPYQDATAWVGSNNIEYVAHEGISFDGPTGRLILFCLTPEQAVEATLGRGTCKDIAETPKFSDKTRFECSACGYEYSAVGGFGCDYGDEPDFNFCPSCGREVVES